MQISNFSNNNPFVKSSKVRQITCLSSHFDCKLILSKYEGMRKEDIIKSWYPNETLSDDEVKAIYDNLLNLFLLLYQESQIHDAS